MATKLKDWRKHTVAGWNLDRHLVAAKQKHEILHIRRHYGNRFDEPELNRERCQPSKILAVIDEMRKDNKRRQIRRVDLMEELDKRNLLYHEPPTIDETGTGA